MKVLRKILIFCPYYRPASKAGGGARSVANFVDYLKKDHEIKTFSSAFDIDNKKIVENADVWIGDLGEPLSFYAENLFLYLKSVYKELNGSGNATVYLNSFFSWRYTLVPVLVSIFALNFHGRFVLAPRGELADSALSHKKYKKIAYRIFFDFILRFFDLSFQASSEKEKQQILSCLKWGKVIVARDIPVTFTDEVRKRKKEKELVRLVFFSRVHPIKNLDYLIEVILKCDCEVLLDIYGNIEDQDYWRFCQHVGHALIRKGAVTYKGAVCPDNILSVLSEYDFFVLPTKGENFGHAIAEALMAGLPVLISDQTPWNDIEENGAGYVLSLNDNAAWVDAVSKCSEMSNCQYQVMSNNAKRYSDKKIKISEIVEENRKMLHEE